MPPPSMLHLRGDATFRRFDHRGTTIDAATEALRLSTTQEAGVNRPIDPALFEAWLANRGGAAVIPCRPDDCMDSAVLLVERGGDVLVDRGKGLETWPLGASAPSPPTDSLRFGPTHAAPTASINRLAEPAALARDPWGRLWLLERGSHRVVLLAPDDLRPLDTIRAPAGVELIHLAAADAGVLAIDEAGMHFQPYGGEWQPVTFSGRRLPQGARFVAAAGLDEHLIALCLLKSPEVWEPNTPPVRALVALVQRAGTNEARARLVGVPDLANPLPILVLPGGDLLIGELSTASESRTLFTRFSLGPSGLASKATLGARGFDGRAFFLSADGEPTVTTANGLRRLFAVLDAQSRTEGRIETYALDAQRYGCVWHRVFIEACLPPGTSLSIDARTSDELYPDPRPARPPADGAAPTEDGSLFPLGSRATDDDDDDAANAVDKEGWLPMGALDLRPAWADVPFPPEAPVGMQTLEGLIKNPPGRYLWLRVYLHGTKRQSPAISALRVTFPRPSLLDHLPAFWRADAAAAAEMDHVLSLFEGVLTEIDGRIEDLPRLFDPRVCPAETLDWLASFVGLAFDPRLSDDKRRALLREGVRLFRQRGTVPGLTRLCEIVSGFPVDIVEAFRLRRRAATILGGSGSTAATLGPDLLLGGDPLDLAPEGWEVALTASYMARMHGREAARARGEAICPPVDPPPPLDPDPIIAFHRRYAHRFTVVVLGPRDEALASLLDATIERAKPAHTLHDICWLDAGFRLGVTTYVGLGTRLGDVQGWTPAILGQSPLGNPTVLSTASMSRVLGTFVGAARVGTTTFQ